MTVFIVPSLSSVPASTPHGHWLSWLENELDDDAQSIYPAQQEHPDLECWSNKIIQALAHTQRPAWIIANEEGCLAVAHASFSHAHLIAGAMLVMPPPYSHMASLFPEQHNLPNKSSSGLCARTLPFPSVVILRKDEKPSLAIEEQYWAKQWESKIVHIATHPTPESHKWVWGMEFFEHFRAHHESLDFLQAMRENIPSHLYSKKQYDGNAVDKYNSLVWH